MEDKDFDQVLRESWGKEDTHQEHDVAIVVKDKLKQLKVDIRRWRAQATMGNGAAKVEIQKQLSQIDKEMDDGLVTMEELQARSKLKLDLYNLEKIELLDLAQKAKVRWCVEGDENSTFYHGVLNRRRRKKGYPRY